MTIDPDFERYCRSYADQHNEQQEAIATEHQQRIGQGKEQWNAWAKNFAEYVETNQIKDGYIDFSRTKWDDPIDLSGYHFPVNTNFIKATFLGYANFRGATFSGDASFSEATFSGYASFSMAKFSGNASFDGAAFSGTVSLANTTFDQQLDLTQVTFIKVPDFNQVSYKETPYISDMSIPWSVDGNDDENNDKNNVHRYRKLKKMAVDDADHELEVKFFAYETHCKLYLKKTHWMQKSLIWLYWLCSNFGQSLLRPLIGLVLVFALFTGPSYFLLVASENANPLCKDQVLMTKNKRGRFPF